MTQIANLRWLPARVQERILDGTIDGTERDLRLSAPSSFLVGELFRIDGRGHGRGGWGHEWGRERQGSSIPEEPDGPSVKELIGILILASTILIFTAYLAFLVVRDQALDEVSERSGLPSSDRHFRRGRNDVHFCRLLRPHESSHGQDRLLGVALLASRDSPMPGNSKKQFRTRRGSDPDWPESHIDSYRSRPYQDLQCLVDAPP